MNVVIVAPCHVPLVIGGAEKLWWGLLQHLNGDTDHHADIIKLPGPESDFWEVVGSYRAFSELNLTWYDAIISGKYPAWMSDHPRHVCYMLHPLRGLYDSYPDGLSTQCEPDDPELRALLALVRSGEHTREALDESFERLEHLRAPPRRRALRRRRSARVYDFPGPLVRELVHFFDQVAFRPGAIRRFCAISHTVATRDGYFPPGADVTPVHPPSDLTGFLPPNPGRYLFTVSRLDRPKRIDLLIAAMRHIDHPVELLIAGTGPDEPRLRKLAGRDSRIRFLGFVNDAELLGLYADAHAVLFAPIAEDFGLVALEAMAAGKPVVTTHDSGGASELVTHGTTGFITAPRPEAIAGHVEQLLVQPRLAQTMGAEGRERAAGVTWQRVGEVLLDGIEA